MKIPLLQKTKTYQLSHKKSFDVFCSSAYVLYRPDPTKTLIKEGWNRSPLKFYQNGGLHIKIFFFFFNLGQIVYELEMYVSGAWIRHSHCL